MSIADQFKISQLEDEVKNLKMALTQQSNIIEAALIHMSEGGHGDILRAFNLLKEVIGYEDI